jgi:hypothetical protein
MDSSRESGNAPPYWLAPFVHVSLCDRHAVLMDERRNCYVAVQPAEGLAGWVAGWPAGGTGAAAPLGAPPAILAQLLEQGALVSDRRAGSPARPVEIAQPCRSPLEFDFEEHPAPHGRDLRRMAWAWTIARAALQFRSMHWVLERMRARRAGRESSEAQFDWTHAQALVGRFVYLRPLFYTARGACLLDSLTLLLFLQAHGLYPEWVFGVRTAPFHAHCWVQLGPVVFNDLPDHVRQYSAILRI